VALRQTPGGILDEEANTEHHIQQQEGVARIPWTDEGRRFWAQYVFPSKTMIIGFFFALFGISAVIVGVNAYFDHLVHANAQVVGRGHASSLGSMGVEVKFAVTNPIRTVLAYIHPQNHLDLKAHAIIPITYDAGLPTDAYYAGTGGDINDPLPPRVLTIGSLVVILGGVLCLISDWRWRRRMQRLLGVASSEGPMANVCWQDNGTSLIVIATTPTIPWQLSWETRAIKRQSPLQFWKNWLEESRFHFWKRRLDRNDTNPPAVQAGASLAQDKWTVLRSSDTIYLPLSSAQILTLKRQSPHAMALDSSLTYHQRQLLSAYADVLNRIRELPVVFAAVGQRYFMGRAPGFRPLICWRFLIRLYAEAHIRRQLRNLSKLYIREQFLLDSFDNASMKQLSHLRQDCNLFVDSLSDTSRPIASIVIALTVIAPIAPLVLKTNPLPFYVFVETLVWLIGVAVLLTPGAIIVLVYSDSFRFKRQLFGEDLPKIMLDRPESIYKLETKVFDMLDQPKYREVASDLLIRGALIAVLCAYFAVILYRQYHYYGFIPTSDWIPAGAILGLLIFSLAKAVERRRRAER
jgi:hypothetical protein